MGSLIMGGLGAYAMNGDNMTGRAPSDPAERDAFYRQGRQPYSFRNPLDNKWTSYTPLQPYTPLFAAAANIAQSLKADPKNREDLTGLATLAAVSAGQSLVDMPWTQGLADAIDIVSNRGVGSDDPRNKIEQWLERQAAGVVPGAAAMRTLARAQDDIIRDPDNILEAMMANTPGLQSRVKPKLDAFGYEMRRPTSGLDSVINPFNPSAPTDEPVEKELEWLQRRGYDVQPGFVGKSVAVGSQDVKLSDEQYRQLETSAGHISYAVLQALVGSPEWKSMSDAKKEETVNKVISRTRDVARKTLKPELVDDAVQQLVDQMDARQEMDRKEGR